MLARSALEVPEDGTVRRCETIGPIRVIGCYPERSVSKLDRSPPPPVNDGPESQRPILQRLFGPGIMPRARQCGWTRYAVGRAEWHARHVTASYPHK